MKSNIVPKASPDALPELVAFLEPFAPLFRRHTSRDSMERYLTGPYLLTRGVRIVALPRCGKTSPLSDPGRLAR